MRLTIRHHTRYSYETPLPYVLQRLRLHPRNDSVQTVREWTLTLAGCEREARYRDGFGNDTLLVSSRDGVDHLDITAQGIVETRDTAGVTGHDRNSAPLWIYEQETPLTLPGKSIRAMAAALKAREPLERLHELMEHIAGTIAYEVGQTHSATTAEEALTGGHGVCQDHAHVFCAAARLAGIPARYVSGYLFMEGTDEQAASHAWAEAHVDGLGWVGFDCANKICPDERYVRLAHGRDYDDASPVSGLRYGQSGESLAVSLNVAQ
ncbi:MAG: transglutaminase family protein [Notoacmeibacter sp.]|nr:transglutaminase family protein [Notoacmeibacter sp.]